MLLSDVDIAAQVNAGRLRVSPFSPELMQPASLDVCLSPQFREVSKTSAIVDPKKPQESVLVDVGPDMPYILSPNRVVLGSTIESVTLPNDIAARFEGKSSLGRLGLAAHITAGFIDPGFSGAITLELASFCGSPIALWPGMKIGQLCFYRMTGAARNVYGSAAAGSHYQGQDGPTASKSHKRFYIHGSIK